MHHEHDYVLNNCVAVARAPVRIILMANNQPKANSHTNNTFGCIYQLQIEIW